MADKKALEHFRVGPFRIGRKFDEVGPELGQLYESWHEATGQPAVTLRPGERVHWLHRGPWRLGLSCEHDSPDVSLTVQEAPPFAPPTQVADLLVLMDAALQRVEDSPRLLAHFAAGPMKAHRAGWLPQALAGAAALALGLGLWFRLTTGTPHPERPHAAQTLSNAPSAVGAGDPTGPGMAYPMPKQPFRNQARAPCRTQRLEVEINGGCWVALEQRPPCAEARAEYEGKCYLPVAKEEQLPNSTGP